MIRKGIKGVVVGLYMIVAPASACAQQTIAEVFEKMPLEKTLYITLNDKREMIECWNQKLDTSVKNKLDGMSSIDTLAVDYAVVKLSDAKQLTLFLLPSAESGSVVGLITTLYTPKPQSTLEVYSTDWKLLYDAKMLNLTEKELLHKPEAMTQEKYEELRSLIAQTYMNFEYNSQAKQMSASLSVDVLSVDKIQEIQQLIIKQLLIWDGKVLKNK